MKTFFGGHPKMICVEEILAKRVAGKLFGQIQAKIFRALKNLSAATPGMWKRLFRQPLPLPTEPGLYQSLDSISSINLLTSMTIKTSSLRYTRAHY